MSLRCKWNWQSPWISKHVARVFCFFINQCTAIVSRRKLFRFIHKTTTLYPKKTKTKKRNCTNNCPHAPSPKKQKKKETGQIFLGFGGTVEVDRPGELQPWSNFKSFFLFFYFFMFILNLFIIWSKFNYNLSIELCSNQFLCLCVESGD